MRSIRKAPKGFTLIEILIVVIILGILAAIVIPQFSNASSSAKQSSVQSMAQTLRSQVALYRLQHNDTLPPAGANFWTQMTSYTLADGTVTSAGTTGAIPPYMQSVATNSFNQATTVTDVPNVTFTPGGTNSLATAAMGWVYDYNSGAGTGRVYGTDTTGTTVVGP